MGRVKLSSLAGDPVEDVPGQSSLKLVLLRPDQLAATPLNPRQNFGAAEELTELGESMRVRQLQPVVAVSRAAYLKLWPDHEKKIGSAEYVLANGERRYRASLHVGLDGIDTVIRDEVAESRESFLDAVVSENLDRRNFDAIEEATAVEWMVQECGSGKAAAERFRKGEAWISQRRALLKLSPDLQQRVRTGELPLRIARSIASLPHGEQEDAWQHARTEQAAETQQRVAARKTDPGGDGQPAPEVPGPRRSAEPVVHREDPRPGESKVFTAVKTKPDPAERKEEQTASAGPPGMPWHSPEALALLIRQRVTPADVVTLVRLLTEDLEVLNHG